jgi:Xaa-Pro dipeptidase
MEANALDPALRSQCLRVRQEKVRDALGAAGLDGIVAYGTGRHSFLASNPAWYLTAFRQLGTHMAMVLPVSGEGFIVMTPVWDRGRLAQQLEGTEIIAVQPRDFLATMAGEIARRNLRGKRYAVAGGAQLRAVEEAWPSMFSTAPVSADRLISDISRIRDAWSLACVRQAAAIAEEGWRRCLEIARPGMAEFELAAETEAEMRLLGAEDNFQLLSASLHNKAVHRPSQRILQAGDVLLGEITPAVGGEFVQICRTAVFGGPTERQQELFALLDGALRGAMRAAKPGAPARDIARIINAPIAAAGYEAYTKPPYMRTRGHSMGFGSMDPEISLDSNDTLLEGMAFVLHPNQYLPDTGYMMCGEPVLITADGARALTDQMGELGTIPV